MAGRVDVWTARRPLLESDLEIRHVDELEALDQQAYAQWLKEPLKPPKKETYVFNLRSIRETSSGAEMECSYTDYRSTMLLRRVVAAMPPGNPERQRLMETMMPVGGQMILQTSDNHILIEERGPVEVPGKYNPAPAGGPETLAREVPPEPFLSIIGEAWEEIAHVLHRHYTTPELLGMARDWTDAYNPTLTYTAESRYSIERIRQKAALAPEAGEHVKLFGVPVDERAVAGFLLKEPERIVGNGLGGILVWGSHTFDRAWFEDTSARLREAGWDIREHKGGFPERKA